MGALVPLFIVSLVETTICWSARADDSFVTKTAESSTADHHGHYQRRPASWSREIVEISDPTTDSTLHIPQYVIDCTNDKECEAATADTTPMPTFKPYTQEELNSYLKQYAQSTGQLPIDEPSNKLASVYVDEPVNILENDKESAGAPTSEKSKSWQSLQNKDSRPYDDRTGWVTLEPVPWSASQIQKWEPNRRPPEIPQWGETPGLQQASSTWQRPNKWQDRPWNNKNTYEYKPSHWGNSKPGAGGGSGGGWGGGNPDIITDGNAAQFPHEQGRPAASWYDRPHTEVVYQGDKEIQSHPHSHPTDGDGRWVLLSSTKGYSVPQRGRSTFQRALFNGGEITRSTGQSVKSHRSVRLTVLPPLNGSANTTTSHGGLLEVEQTFQTVDEAQREHAAKMLKLENLNKSTAQPHVASKRSGHVSVYHPVPAITQNSARSNAMLAAVGAGMIPATVAMLLPMMLGKRRRRRSPTPVVDSFEHWLPRTPLYEYHPQQPVFPHFN